MITLHNGPFDGTVVEGYPESDGDLIFLPVSFPQGGRREAIYEPDGRGKAFFDSIILLGNTSDSWQ